MIREEELKEALEIFRQSEPTPELLRLSRSRQWQRRRYVLRRWAKDISAVVLVILAIGFASPKVRAAVSGWMANWLEDQTVYENRGEQAPEGSGDYMLTWVPEGCKPVEMAERDNGNLYSYKDQSGRYFYFSYSHNTSDTDGQVWLDAGTDDVQKVTVNGRSAELYAETEPEYNAVLVWESDDTGTLFRLQGYFEPEIMLQIAESVVETG